MRETRWLPSTVEFLDQEFLDQDLTDALAIHEAIVAGLRRLRRGVKEIPPGLSPDGSELRELVRA